MYLKLGPLEFSTKANPQAGNIGDYIGATVTRRDEFSSSRSQQAIDPEVAWFLSRFRGQVMTCVMGNAQVCARNPQRLYKRAKAERDGRTKGLRQVPRAKRTYLASGRAGVKAASWAEQQGDIVEVTSHPVLDLLNRPNGFDTGGEFWELQYLFKMVAGHAFEWYVADQYGVNSIFTLLPQHTTVVRDSDDYVTGYSYGREGGRVLDFDASETVMYKRALHPSDPFAGLSMLEGLREEIDLAQANLDFDLEFVKEGQMPPFVVALPENSTDDQVKEARKHMREELGGIRGKLRGWVLRQSTVTPLNITPRELQSKEKQDDILQRIRQRFGWTESMHDSNASTRAAAIVGYSAQYLGTTIAPMVIRDAEQRTERMLPLFGLEPGEWFLAADDPVADAVQEEEDASRADVASGIMSINEARQARGLDPVGDGNALRVNGVPLDTLAQGPQPSQIPVTFNNSSGGVPVIDNRTNEGDGVRSLIAEEMAKPPRWAAYSGPPAQRVAEPHPAEVQATAEQCCTDHAGTWGDFRTIGPDEARHIGHPAAKDLPAPPWLDQQTERDIRPIAEDYLADLRDAVIENGGKPLSDQQLREFREQFEGEMRPALERALRRSATAALDDIGLAASLDDFSPTFAIDFLNDHLPRLAGEVTQTQLEAVTEAVQGGLESGASITDIRQDLEAQGFERARAERIARTETQIASGEGAMAGYQEVGVEKKEWLLAPGNCPLCQGIADRVKAAGGSIPMSEPFATAGEVINGQKVPWTVMMHPAHPNCRCRVVGVEEE